MTTLERFRVLQTRDVDEFRSNIARFLTPHRLVPAGVPVDFRTDLAMVDLGSVSLVYGRNEGAELHADLTDEVDYYDVNLALAGHNILVTGEDRTRVDRQTGGIISPRMRARMELSDGYAQLHVRIERPALERELERLLDRPLLGPVRFAPTMDLTRPAAASWAQAVRLLVSDLDDPAGLAGGAHNPWNHFLLAGLLQAQPHNYSAQLQDRQALRRPLPLKKVLDRIEADPAGEHSIDSLARLAGTTPRSLQRHFKEYVGASPLAYLQGVRLTRAHEELAAAEPGTTVGDVALRWGFTHLSRFAGAYQQRYGVAPSVTLRRRS
jgi:AraC-like DNA-binding protein